MRKLIKLLETENNVFWEFSEMIKGAYLTSDYNKEAYLFYKNENSPLLLQAHIDTADWTRKTPTVIQEGNILRAKDSILGADDRAGVYAIAKIISICQDKGLTLPNVLLTDDEEIGGKGMEIFIRTHKLKKLKHINLAISLDRRGVGDYVEYVKNQQEVKSYIEFFGFHSAQGSYSDIKDFSVKYKIPSVNLSIGYHNEHSKNEFLCIDEMELTIKRLIEIIKDPIEYKYKCKPYAERNYGKWFGHGYTEDPVYSTYDNEKFLMECDYCGSYSNLTKVQDQGVSAYVCETCLAYIMDDSVRPSYPIGA